MLSVKQKLKLLAYALGIFVSYTLFGVLQEKIFRGRYGEEISQEDGQQGERFTFSVAFVAVQCVAYTLFAKGVILARDHPENETHQKFYFFGAVFYVTAMVTSNMALAWISYPTQVVAKASKPIPVMILGVLIGKKSYAAQKYFFVMMIVIGVGLFIFKDKYDAKEGENYLIGGYLIGFSLLMDGFTGAVQDRMRCVCKPTSMNFMYYVNGWSSLVLITLMSGSGEGRDLIQFAQRHPTVIWEMALVVLVGTVGQVFISEMISNFGSLPLSLVTTTRKFFTVLVSVVAFENKLTLTQWIASGIIFSALLLDAIFSKKKTAGDESSTQVTEPEENASKQSNLKLSVPSLNSNLEDKIAV